MTLALTVLPLAAAPPAQASHYAFARIEAGDYEGTREVNGMQRKSIFREYADGVVAGLVDYYRKQRRL